MNKSKQFILPLFCEFIFINFKVYNKILNTYIYSKNFKNNGLILECKKSIKEEDSFLETIYDSDLLIDLEEKEETTIYYLKIPNEYKEEYNKLEKGLYSKVSKDIKDLILKFYIKVFKNDSRSINLIVNTKHILFKDGKLKRRLEKNLNVNIEENAELADPPNEKKENYDCKIN